MHATALQQALTRVTPASLRAIIMALAKTQAPDNQDGVTLMPIIEALTEGQDLGAGAEGWQAYLKLKPDAEDRKDVQAEIEDLGG